MDCTNFKERTLNKSKIYLNFVDTAGQHKFHLSRESFSSMNIAFFMQRQAIFQEDFNVHHLRLVQTGIVRQLFDISRENILKFGKARARVAGRVYVTKRDHVLEMRHLTGCFYLLSILLAVSVIAFIIEVLWKYATSTYGHSFLDNSVYLIKTLQT